MLCMSETKNWIKFSIFNIAIAIAMGAFGAHSLKARFEVSAIATWNTASYYHLTMSMGLLLMLLTSQYSQKKKVALISMRMVAIGTLVFSISLYALVLSGIKWLGAITPIGGVLLILGWLLFATSKIEPFSH